MESQDGVFPADDKVSWIVCSNNQNSFKIVVKRTHLKSEMIASLLKLDLEDKNLSLVNLSRI